MLLAAMLTVAWEGYTHRAAPEGAEDRKRYSPLRPNDRYHSPYKLEKSERRPTKIDIIVKGKDHAT